MEDFDREAGEQTQRVLYRELLRHALVRLVVLYFIPLLLLTLFFHLQYRLVVKDAEERHRQTLAVHQAVMLEMFLGDRLLNLTDLAGDAAALIDPDPAFLRRNLEALRSANEAFVDLAVLDGSGRVLGYAGPLPHLVERNYGQEGWFTRLLAGESSHVITDVYMGFRGQPHFTMALKLEPRGSTRVLRAVLSPETVQAQVAKQGMAPAPSGGILQDIATNIWLFSGVFCLSGGIVIFLQARWVARQQFTARQKERQLNRQLVQAAKLASVGELASGIAHEINNPLAVVAEKAGLVRDLLDPKFGKQPAAADLRRHLEVIDQAVFRCAEITRQLLGFVRQADVRLVTGDLHDLIDEMIEGLLGPELHAASMDVKRDYDRAIGPVTTDPGRLQQVLVNLVKNALDAVRRDHGPGTITITTRAQGDRFLVKVADDGCGMTPEQLEMVFMPFFTTKEPGKGTGLGLSVSYGIIQGLGGRLSAASTHGMGSEFTIELPLRR